MNRVKLRLALGNPMPKLKTRKAAAKRFQRTGSGKIMRRKAYRNHLLRKKNATRKRRLFGLTDVHERDAQNVELMLPYL
jgi:large subunit ribosomal protein L35